MTAHNAVSPFIHRFYDEAMALLVEWRSVVAYKSTEKDFLPTQEAKLTFATHSLDLTTGLAHLMGWVLARRAVAAGEIAPSDVFAPRFAQARHNPLLLNGANHLTTPGMPSAYHDILKRTLALSERAKRLEEVELARLTETASV